LTRGMRRLPPSNIFLIACISKIPQMPRTRRSPKKNSPRKSPRSSKPKPKGRKSKSKSPHRQRRQRFRSSRFRTDIPDIPDRPDIFSIWSPNDKEDEKQLEREIRSDDLKNVVESVIKNKKIERLNYLLHNNLEHKFDNKLNWLHMAAKFSPKDEKDLIRLVTEYYYDDKNQNVINDVDDDGNTPLHYATKKDNTLGVELLFVLGAESKKNNAGELPQPESKDMEQVFRQFNKPFDRPPWASREARLKRRREMIQPKFERGDLVVFSRSGGDLVEAIVNGDADLDPNTNTIYYQLKQGDDHHINTREENLTQLTNVRLSLSPDSTLLVNEYFTKLADEHLHPELLKLRKNKYLALEDIKRLLKTFEFNLFKEDELREISYIRNSGSFNVRLRMILDRYIDQKKGKSEVISLDD